MSAIAILLDHVVGKRQQQRRRNIDAERLRRFEIDYKVKFRRLRHRQIAEFKDVGRPPLHAIVLKARRAQSSKAMLIE